MLFASYFKQIHKICQNVSFTFKPTLTAVYKIHMHLFTRKSSKPCKLHCSFGKKQKEASAPRKSFSFSVIENEILTLHKKKKNYM